MLTYGLLMQLIISLSLGAVMGYAATLYVKLPSSYIYTVMLVQPVTFTLLDGFKKYFDAEGTTMQELLL